MSRDYGYDSNGMNPFFTALVGGAIGAATALFFSDERRRRKVGDFINEVRDRGAEYQDQFEDTTDQIVRQARRVGRKVADTATQKERELEEEVNNRLK